ncbi:pancreatic triacylglycerol lipase-like [Maniola hyperantus]|uniref:pancreatic triacylglycerol lipase-like n=1 Tax=Aphantopus hyperantus TaxID=2795564 RepID=UPI0015686839|nr:pancreatic triacylglycerol lipase-like [Maniola hyperantus]
MTQAFLASGHINLIALDASSVLNWIYPSSTSFVRFIGEKLGQVLAAIVQQGQNPSDIHIIGHSLGAHIAGFAGKTFRKQTGKNLGRISGLDPAGPCFNAVNPDARLKPTDAEFVDIMHTDATMYGINEPVGHVDYYPNGGSSQPGCLLLGCSHNRSWMLYVESVLNPLAFPARKCKDWDAFKKGQCESEISYMGHPSGPATSNGHYWLQTADKFPYGLGLNGTNYKKTSFFYF